MNDKSNLSLFGDEDHGLQPVQVQAEPNVDKGHKEKTKKSRKTAKKVETIKPVKNPEAKSEQELYQLVVSLVTHLQRLFVLPQDSIPSSGEFLKLVVSTVISRGSLLLFSPPGYAKSTLINLIAKFFGIIEEYPHFMVTGSMQTSEEHVVGAVDHYRAINTGEKNVEWAYFLDSPLRAMDELDKFNQYSLNAYLPVLAQGVALVGSHRKKVRKVAHIMAMNSPDSPGSANFQIPEYMKDRVDIELRFPDNSFVEDEKILDLTFGEDQEDLVEAMPTEGTPEDLLALYDLVSSVEVSENAKKAAAIYKGITNFCKKGAKSENKTFPGCCADCELSKAKEDKIPCSLVSALSIRAAQSAVRVGKGIAFLESRQRVEKSHIDMVFPYVMSHRVSYVGEIPDNRLRKAKTFFDHTLKAAGTTIYNIIVEPEKMITSPEMRDRFEKSANPLIQQAMSAVKEKLDGINANVLETLGQASTGVLKEVLAKFKLDTSQKNLVKQMLLARQTIYLELQDEEMLEDESFRSIFATPAPSCEPYLSDRGWEEVAAEGKVTSAFSGVGVDINYDKTTKILSVQYEGSEYADDFTQHLNDVLTSGEVGWLARIRNPYEMFGIMAQIEKAGFMKGVVK